ncbi:MAG: hypothetical protein V4604_09295 [Bacteroidota bacterium]
MDSKEHKEIWTIHPPYEVFYIERIFSAAQSAILSWGNLQDVILHTPDFRTIQMSNFRIISYGDNIINQAGIISRYFYPPNNRDKKKNKLYQSRGNGLKLSYDVTDDNILKNRSFRNHLEHFDENLDHFLNKPVAGNIFPMAVFQDISQIDSITHLFKAFVINQNSLISLGQEISLLPLMEEIYRIEKVSSGFLKNGRLS